MAAQASASALPVMGTIGDVGGHNGEDILAIIHCFNFSSLPFISCRTVCQLVAFCGIWNGMTRNISPLLQGSYRARRTGKN